MIAHKLCSGHGLCSRRNYGQRWFSTARGKTVSLHPGKKGLGRTVNGLIHQDRKIQRLLDRTRQNWGSSGCLPFSGCLLSLRGCHK